MIFIFPFQIGIPPMNVVEKNVEHPHIIACGDDIKHIIQYYMVIEQKIITVNLN